MLISHKCKFITIDIPKTGTRSLRTTLLPLGVIDIIGSAENKDFPQHGTAIECKNSLKNLGFDFNEYFSFCIVRNPWDRYFSFFKYFKEKREEYLNSKNHNEWNVVKIAQGKNCVELFKEKNPTKVLEKIIKNNPCQSYYYLNKNKSIVSHVGQFNDLQKELDYLCEKASIEKQTISHENKSSLNISFSDVYNQELIDLVAEKEKDVIETYGYTL